RQPAKWFTDLIVWIKAHQLVVQLYQITREFPAHETYGLRSQIRRAAISIPANIAEGFAKRGIADKARYFNVAQGSLEEVRYYLILSHDLGYCAKDDLFETLSEVSKLLEAYRACILKH
ncbi:MAG TPA: four helix bundle protein, partial [Gemmatales bacterium]|nr:four helix bundle protein [Gemmatales bacterium]